MNTTVKSQKVSYRPVAVECVESARYAVLTHNGAYLGDVVKYEESQAVMSGSKRYADYFTTRTTWEFEGSGVSGDNYHSRASAARGLLVALKFNHEFAERITGAAY